ncbi:hypothetical protein P4O66_000693 [Electrophorus voltai]|uniref:Reverse transcriptase domain-containing protein n=1 Tax=Electrophorus voltai TaxID=2609070 RepID=A0AAD8ZIL2_9TELE|nr:hypothetical protein P4O66_000693 [Electrophorus voltai]
MSLLTKFSLEVTSAKSSYYREKFESSSSSDPRKLFTIFSSLLNPPPPSSSLTPEDFITFFEEKVAAIRQAFSSVPTPPTNMHSPTSNFLTSFSPLSTDEILKLLTSSNLTTCLLDPIPSALFQTIARDLLPFISVIINNSLSSGYVLTASKTARVVPILKKATLDSSSVPNYGPVSLHSFLSKTLERAVYNQLSLFLTQNQLHDPNQSGYKPAHSTETALIAVTEKLHAAKAAKLSSGLILLDLSAAFDTVNHNILLSVLSRLGVTGSAWRWFQSYLEGQSHQVTWRGSTSKPCRLSPGAPQGSVLGPLLFSLYTHSLGDVKSSHGFSYHCYADDTQLFLSFPPSDTQVSIRILASLTDIASWMTAHHLKLSPSKTELLFIPGTPNPYHDLTVSFENSLVSPSEAAHSLGVTLDNQLSFSTHVSNLTWSCRFLLYNIQRIRLSLSQEATQMLVQSLVISKLDNCNSLLAGLPLRAIKPLQLFQNAAAQLVFNRPKFTRYSTAALPSLAPCSCTHQI